MKKAVSLSGCELARKIFNSSHGDISGLLALAGDENSWLELKAGMYARSEDMGKNENEDDNFWHIARAIIAFMNTAGGVLLIGVQDKTFEVVPIRENDPHRLFQQQGEEAYLRQAVSEHLPPLKMKWNTGTRGNWILDGTIPESTVEIEKTIYKNEIIAAVFVKPVEECLTVKHGVSEVMLVREAGAIGKVKELKTFAEMNSWVKNRKITNEYYGSTWARYLQLQKNGFHYYAFISYSHKDEKWAKWIQESLESYRLPSAVQKEIGKDKPNRIAPVFRDATDLSAGKLVKELRHELANSKYMIVICSPDSAKPNANGNHYVNDEVEYFASQGKSENIIPVIVGGTPDGTADECFCPEIKKLGLLGIDATGMPRKIVLNNIVAKILNLHPDVLWKRYRRARIRHFILQGAGILSILLLSFLLFIFTGSNSLTDKLGLTTEAQRYIESVLGHSASFIHYSADDPGKWDGGSMGNRPYWRGVVQTKDGKTYLVSCPWGCIQEAKLMYLGTKIEISKIKDDDTYLMVRYNRKMKKNIYTGISISDFGTSYEGNDNIYPCSQTPAEEKEAYKGKYSAAGFSEKMAKQFDLFWPAFWNYLKADNRTALADILQYPIDVYLDGREKYTVKDKKTLIELYDQVFYPEYKAAILKSNPKDGLYISWRGVGVANQIMVQPHPENGNITIELNNQLSLAEQICSP